MDLGSVRDNFASGGRLLRVEDDRMRSNATACDVACYSYKRSSKNRVKGDVADDRRAVPQPIWPQHRRGIAPDDGFFLILEFHLICRDQLVVMI